MKALTNLARPLARKLRAMTFGGNLHNKQPPWYGQESSKAKTKQGSFKSAQKNIVILFVVSVVMLVRESRRGEMRVSSRGGDHARQGDSDNNKEDDDRDDTRRIAPSGYPWHNRYWSLERQQHDNHRGEALDRLGAEIERILTHDDYETNPILSPVYYLLRDGEVFAHSPQRRAVWSQSNTGKRRVEAWEGMLLRAASRLRKGEEMELVFEWGDFSGCPMNQPQHHLRWTWSMTTLPDHCPVFAVPSYDVWHKACRPSLLWRRFPVTPAEYDAMHSHYQRRYPWKSKIPKVVWRGSTTGRPSPYLQPSTETPPWKRIPRSQLVDIGKEHSDVLDVAFSQLVQLELFTTEEMEDHADIAEEIRRDSRVVKKMNSVDYMKYRAILDIDGNSWSSRFGSLLCTNSVILKVNSTHVNHFDSELQPWHHYIPVQADLSDVVEQATFATSEQNVNAVQSIIHNANQWCRARMTASAMVQDVYWMLRAYHQEFAQNKTALFSHSHGDSLERVTEEKLLSMVPSSFWCRSL